MLTQKQKIIVLGTLTGILLIGAILSTIMIRHFASIKPLRRFSETKVLSIQTPGLATDSKLSGEQILEAKVDGLNLTDYDIYWSIDAGLNWQLMEDNPEKAVKQAKVNISAWPAAAENRYELSYRAVNKSGLQISFISYTIYTEPSVAVAKTPEASQASARKNASIETPPPVPPVASFGKPFAASQFYIQPNSPAAKQAEAWRNSRPADAAVMDKLAAQPTAKWINTSTSNPQSVVSSYISAAGDKIPLLVLYAIPQVHISNPSSGKPDKASYLAWINSIKAGLGGRSAMVIVEPDALPLAGQLSSDKRQERYDTIREAVEILKQGGARVYIDAGHPGWLSASAIAERLRSAGIDKADGFSLNISNFVGNDSNISYGNAISDLVGGKHFVIDTSRNGLGPAPGGEWCNPPGRAVGQTPTLSTPQARIDAYIWIKIPGESDGTCNGGPNAGTFWPDYALGLGQRAGF